MAKERETLREDGWAEVVAGRQDEVQDRLYAMNVPRREFDERTSRKLARLDARRQKLDAKLQDIDHDDEEGVAAVQDKMAILDQVAQEIVQAAPVCFGEKTKAVGTVFLMIDPDGQVRREFRVARPERRSTNGNGPATAGSPEEQPRPPTSEDLSENQLAVTFTHQALALREALLKNPGSRNRILALILHDKVRSEALAIRHDANAVTLQATKGEGFTSQPLATLTEKHAELDPFVQDHFVEDQIGYRRLNELSDSRLGRLIELLVVECVTAHLQRRTELVCLLATELKVDIRRSWRPDAAWLAGYQKIQLAHLMAELRGTVYDPARDTGKKSELVDALAKLYSDAAEGTLEDKQLAERANAWLPANLREVKQEAPEEPTPPKRKRS
jgi:hypothetical protein